MENNDKKLRRWLGAIAILVLVGAGFGFWALQGHADPPPTPGYNVVTLADLGAFSR